MSNPAPPYAMPQAQRRALAIRYRQHSQERRWTAAERRTFAHMADVWASTVKQKK